LLPIVNEMHDIAAGASFGTYVGRPMADRLCWIRDRANRILFKR
jgi:hypothetical protein